MHSLPTPINLTLTFSPQQHSIAVRWEALALGVRHSRLVLPYRGDTLTLVLRALDIAQSSSDPSRRLSAHEQDQLLTLGLWHSSGWIFPDAGQRIGRTLYRALTADPRGAQALGSVRDNATASNQPLALNLRLPPGAGELAALPWELLWDDGSLPLLLGRGRVSACTRYLDLPQALPGPRPHTLPLRILALVPHAGIPEPLREQEQHARRRAWQPLLDSGQVTMEELGPVTRQALVDRLQREPLPDVVHYYGHGCYRNGGGALLLDEADSGECWTNAEALAALLGSVRMVTLFACQGAAVDHTHSLLSGVAPALSAAGVPIVVGMQTSVRVAAATRASGVMYRALAAGWSVQQALSLARQALYVEENDRASWYVPVLYIRTPQIEPVYLLDAPRHHSAEPAPAAAQHAQQTLEAHHNSQIARVRLRAAQVGQQHIQATRDSTISDATLESP
jgi:hypothetical protein